MAETPDWDKLSFGLEHTAPVRPDRIYQDSAIYIYNYSALLAQARICVSYVDGVERRLWFYRLLGSSSISDSILPLCASVSVALSCTVS